MELEDCDKELLNDLSSLRDVLRAAADGAGATVLEESFHRFDPHGISGVIIIAESHLFIHTWPEYGYAAADIFTCGDTVQPEKAAEILIEKLGSRHHTMVELKRGKVFVEQSTVG